MAVRLLIADDHAAVRRGLKQLFNLTTDLVVTQEAADGDQAMQAVCGGGIDLALIDLNMPGLSGISLIDRIHAHDGKLPIVVLSMVSEQLMMQRAQDAGARGYLVKGCDGESIVEAIRRIVAGAQWVEWPPRLRRVPTGMEGALSPFGKRVMLLLAKGHHLVDVASRLRVSAETVAMYVECAKKAQHKGPAEPNLPERKTTGNEE